MKQLIALGTMITTLICFSEASVARPRRGGEQSERACLQQILAVEANPTKVSMLAVGGFANYNGKKSGSICAEAHKKNRYGMKHLGRARQDAVKWAMAGQMASLVLQRNVQLACSEFRTAGVHKGRKIGGNVFFGCSGSGKQYATRTPYHSRRQALREIDHLLTPTKMVTSSMSNRDSRTAN